jgi:hypothetical protein
MEELSVLILGAGWTATFLIPLLESHNIPFAATTTTGRPVANVPTIPFKFDPSLPDAELRTAIAALPRARYILVTFPLTGPGHTTLLAKTYLETHLTPLAAASYDPAAPLDLKSSHFRFLQLGSTGIWQPPRGSAPSPDILPKAEADPWVTRHSPYHSTNPRARAEDELRALGGCVLNLAGLWGGARLPRNWVGRVAASKDAVRARGSLHLVHGADIARAVVAIVEGGEEWWVGRGAGQRWMVTDGWVYDWWGLLMGWAEGGGEGEGEVSEQARWVGELMREMGVRALPRGVEVLGRGYDSREFWEAVGLVPLKGRAG